jgi:hypothetical protein
MLLVRSPALNFALAVRSLASRLKTLPPELSSAGSTSAWENSSAATPSAMVDHLCRVRDVLEAEGIRFSDSGVCLQRPAPMAGTVLHSEGAAK